MAQVEELKSIVLQTLDGKGVLAKLRAQLRQHVYEAISEVPQEDGASPPSKMLEGEDTQLLIGVIADFLKAYDLTHTLSVLCVETGYPKSNVLSDRFRNQLADKLLSKTRPEDPVLKGWYEKLERPSTNPQQGDFSRPSTNPQQGDFRSTFNNDGPTENVSLGERVSLDEPPPPPEREPAVSPLASPSADKLGSSQPPTKSGGLLGDLPSLTTKPKSSLLGDLPPMGGAGGRLAPLSSDDPLSGSRSKAPVLAPLSKDADDEAEMDKKKLEELDAQLQKIESTRGAARSDALSEAVSKQAAMKIEQDDTAEDDIPESVKSESEEFEEESISGGESGKSVDLGQSQMEESSANVFGRDVSVDSMDQSLDHAESVEG
jgi:hypothetical protein